MNKEKEGTHSSSTWKNEHRDSETQWTRRSTEERRRAGAESEGEAGGREDVGLF